MDNFDLKKFLGGKSLLNESAPGYDTRKFGEPLPTLESVKAAHEAKEGDKKEIKEAKMVRVDADEIMMHINQYQRGNIDGDDLAQAIEEIVVGKVAAPGLNEIASDGYVELMDIDDHLEDIHYEWEKWREGPMTEPKDIDPARADVIQYVINYLKRSLK